MKQLLAAMCALTLSACAPHLNQTTGDDLYVLTSLPLFWGEGDIGDILSNRSAKAPIVVALEAKRRVIPLETAARGSLAKVRLLIVAQPRRLAPSELVALDAWVRRGGRLLIFTDPMLDWPSERSLDDVRHAPPVGLLDPLFAHWGLELGDADMATPKMQIRALDRAQVATSRPGRWSTKHRRCAVESELLARCRVGLGVAYLVADADLLNSALWNAPGAANQSAILALVERVATTKSF
jgi:ABC-type uncharacterized transport system